MADMSAEIEPRANILNANASSSGEAAGHLPGLGGPTPSGESPVPSKGPKRFGGIGGRMAAAGLATLGFLGAGGFIANQEFNGGDDPNDQNSIVNVLPDATPTLELPTATPTPTETPLPKVEAKFPYKYVNPVTKNGVTLDVTEGMLTRTEGPDNVYSGEQTKKVPYYSMNGMEFNTTAFPGAAKMVHDGFEYGLLKAWSIQENIPANQQDLVIHPGDSDEVKLQKFHNLQDRMAKGEVFDIKIKANRDDSFILEDVDMKWDKDWTYAIDEIDTPTPFITWQTDGRSGVRISPDAKQFRVELFYRYAGAQGLFSEKIFISSQTVDTLKYLPELVKTKKIPDLLVPNSATKEGLRADAVDIAQKFFIPDARIDTLGKDWKDSTIHPLP